MNARDQGFTRIELLFVLLGVGLLGLPVLSLLGSNQNDAQRVLCANNLRQIGQGSASWAGDHSEQYPWRVPYLTDGGTSQHPLGGNTWFQFLALSNHLGSPRALVCPADTGTAKIADNWSFGPGGFGASGFRDNALSYFVGLHARPYTAKAIFSGDRNIRYSGNSASCSFLPQPVCRVLFPFDTSIAWTNAIHGKAGNLLSADGAVFFSNSTDLQEAARQGDDNGSLHFLSK